MVDDTKEQHDVETEYRYKEQLSDELTSNNRDSHRKEKRKTTLAEVLDEQENDRACTPAALTVVLLNFMFPFHTSGALPKILPIDGGPQRNILLKSQPSMLHLFHFFPPAVHLASSEFTTLCDSTSADSTRQTITSLQ